MALIKCSECGKEISDKASKCVHCGTPIDLQDNQKKNNIEKNNYGKKEELKDEKERRKNKNNKNIFLSVINIIRYFIVIFCLIGLLVSIFNSAFYNIAFYLILGIPFCPFIYKKIFNKINISRKAKIIIQIIAPIICFIIAMAI